MWACARGVFPLSTCFQRPIGDRHSPKPSSAKSLVDLHSRLVVNARSYGDLIPGSTVDHLSGVLQCL